MRCAGVVALGGDEKELGVVVLALDAILFDFQQVERYGVG
jgi:hypothetical protein